MLDTEEYFNEEKVSESTYKTNLAKDGEDLETKSCGEVEIWKDEHGNKWEVVIKIVRDFSNAVPKFLG